MVCAGRMVFSVVPRYRIKCALDMLVGAVNLPVIVLLPTFNL
uniref:Uncharacterized protein n=1 Tax=Dulem virus 30 TaxID=3145748 RepID=A0AAU8B3X3_9CAUD